MINRGTYHILWVDDDVDEIRYLLYPLEKDGYRIEKQRYLPEAYNYVRHNRDIDLIVLDLLMPPTDRFGDTPEWLKSQHPNGANGIKLLIRIRETLKRHMPILILSVVPDAIQEMNIDDDKYQPVDFVHKSSNQVQEAIDKIRKILEHRTDEENAS